MRSEREECFDSGKKKVKTALVWNIKKMLNAFGMWSIVGLKKWERPRHAANRDEFGPLIIVFNDSYDYLANFKVENFCAFHTVDEIIDAAPHR